MIKKLVTKEPLRNGIAGIIVLNVDLQDSSTENVPYNYLLNTLQALGKQHSFLHKPIICVA